MEWFCSQKNVCSQFNIFALNVNRILGFKFVHEVCFIKLNKQRKIYKNSSFASHHLCSVQLHVHCAMPRGKKGEQKVPILKKAIGLCPSRSYYCICIHLPPQQLYQRSEQGAEGKNPSSGHLKSASSADSQTKGMGSSQEQPW